MKSQTARTPAAVAGVLIVCLVPAAAGLAETYQNFYATRVISYDPNEGNEWFDDPAAALGGPAGRGPEGSWSVVTLGQQGSITLGFDEALVVTDGPGVDFIVSENPIQITYGVYYGLRFAELIRVQVSSDGTNFAEFPTWCTAPDPGSPFGGIDPSLVSGFAGVSCVWANVMDPDNDANPFDPVEAGGDAFDLADLQTAPEVLDGRVALNEIRYVRLVDVLGDGSESDSNGNPVHDAWGWVDMESPDRTEYEYQPVSADVDALTVIHGAPEPPQWTPGDADRDGDVDSLDYVTLKGHLGLGPDAEWDDGDFTQDGYVDRSDFLLLQANFGAGVGEGGSSEPIPEPAVSVMMVIGALSVLKHRRHGS